MRFAVLIAIFAATFFTPAHAGTFLISGSAPGLIYGTERCETLSFCDVTEAFTQNFSFTVDGDETLPIGSVYSFTYGSGPSGLYNGSFSSLTGDAYKALNLSYEIYISGCPLGQRDCFRLASTRDFSVTRLSPAPVPEPATWAMFLLGLFAIGTAVRRGKTSTHPQGVVIARPKGT
ncbi:MAG: PEP-CTERM sorting domain-containing protein [Sphingopyxis sp.]|uniref:PEPxxWA-CTERM sorting domain-containing protein n=1 Tax=Sphingopyxis sp. TaxID=1908224 RepID=UPI001A404D38|nr:PEPxxWA-CTERM sorting domain-containing protein [Sphingopyxis sp.]MBL9070233.1 PEP-CTERM sorting domain-containing protein [Sphingopyxis sp.]